MENEVWNFEPYPLYTSEGTDKVMSKKLATAIIFHRSVSVKCNGEYYLLIYITAQLLCALTSVTFQFRVYAWAWSYF